MTIALLGTGLLGRAIAERLQSVGHTVTVYNRTTTKALPLQACGITVVTRPEQAMAQADCVVLMLADAAAIRAVLLAPASLAVLRSRTVIQIGTIAQEESLALQAEIERVGGSYCEAPVLGSLAEAQAGTLFVMVGGTEGQFVQWGPLFRSLSREPRLVGPVGKATSLKLAFNQCNCCRNIGIRPEPWIGAAGGCSRRHLHGDLAGERLVRPGVREKTAATPDAGLSASKLFHTSSLEGRGALPEGGLRLRTDDEWSGRDQAGAGTDHCTGAWRLPIIRPS